jgi:hypothetical protein
MNAPLPQTANDAFGRALSGTLYGIMRWEQLSAFWDKVDASAGWYVYAVGETVPAEPADAQHVRQFIADIDALLRKEHEEEYCGIVYVDDLAHPAFIKIYDPNHLGSSCGSSKNPPLPGWTMSQMPPTPLTPTIVAQSRRRWWQGFLASLR